MSKADGALAGIRVLDLTDERGIYGVKLLADLGADVVRPEPPGGDPLRQRGPLARSGGSGEEASPASLWHAWFASNRRFVVLDTETEEDSAQLHGLACAASIVVCTDGPYAQAAQLDEALRANPALVVIDVSSFGAEGPWKDFLAPDLVAGALGGAAATTGDADTAPLKSYGELNFMVSGAYVAIGALAGLLYAQGGGEGQRVGVSVHECIASCLEHVLMWAWYQDKLPSATHRVLPRRGSLHWSNAYVVMKAASGSIMITPAPDFEKQIFWLVEEDAQEDMIDPKYLQPENLPIMIRRLMEVLRGWVGTKDAESLFYEGQERHAPYGWVLPVSSLAVNPQLEARDWWVDYPVGDTTIKGSGAPYQFSETPWRIDQPDRVSADEVLADIGWARS